MSERRATGDTKIEGERGGGKKETGNREQVPAHDP
jgi:hypothetical protein